MFGGTTLSKLFMNVREKLSLCYYASSVAEPRKGLVMVSSGIEFDKYQTYRATTDEQGRQEEFWLGQAAAGLEEDPEELARQLEQVTREQVAESAKRFQLDTIYFLKGKEVRV